ncbi:MAG: hypothetical protein IT162_07045 [Bryobacterales bacterium]|nr:hypothetical protein [Bryobacterales bacterium]
MRAATLSPCRGAELMAAALHGEYLETPPVSFWRHHPEADQHPEVFADSTVAFQQAVDCDFVKITPASSYQTRDYGLIDEWRPDGIGRRTITYRPVRENWGDLPRLNPHDGFAGGIVRAAASIRGRIDASIPVIQTIFSPVFQAAALAARQEALERITGNTVALIHAFLEAGVDGFYFAIQHAQRGSGFGGWARAFDNRCLAAMGGAALRIVHLHGDDIDLSACPDGADILHYDCGAGANPPLDAVQARFDGRAVAGPAAPLPSRRFVYCPGCAVPLAQPDAYWAAEVNRVRQGG